MTTSSDIFTDIKKDIAANRIILYMKGSKMMPMCGFSARVVEALRECGADFETRNILEDENLRAAIKEFSDWPTLPQLYIDQEFIGGCDIVLELFESGELQRLVDNE
ncbi:MAG: Grx4 family monothiol glutaredoxin [Rhabdochlamydiaceae bacterium]|nr:Grx4 family monothiol glutaredoxin [Candidatus Amphrikana amoebophyrae]